MDRYNGSSYEAIKFHDIAEESDSIIEHTVCLYGQTGDKWEKIANIEFSYDLVLSTKDQSFEYHNAQEIMRQFKPLTNKEELDIRYTAYKYESLVHVATESGLDPLKHEHKMLVYGKKEGEWELLDYLNSTVSEYLDQIPATYVLHQKIENNIPSPTEEQVFEIRNGLLAKTGLKKEVKDPMALRDSLEKPTSDSLKGPSSKLKL
ncbi:MAG TPA: hypothetical protein VM577_16145 [Anaerovoracaceae bacterium]|nr:hypothetical protein [Anaerovoracaceae bacterium]